MEEELNQAGLKGRFKTMVGGAPVTQRWARRIGADAFAEDAGEGVRQAKALLGIKYARELLPRRVSPSLGWASR